MSKFDYNKQNIKYHGKKQFSFLKTKILHKK